MQECSSPCSERRDTQKKLSWRAKITMTLKRDSKLISRMSIFAKLGGSEMGYLVFSSLINT